MAAPIVISILSNSRGAVTGIASVRGGLSKLAGGAVIAGGGMAILGKASVKAASDAQQSMGATETVFAKSSDKIIAKSKKAAKQYGLSANVYRENANLIGSLLKNQGVTQDQLAGKTDKMIGTASDLAATFGGTTTDAVGALSSALKGEFDPLERYGISLKQSTVNAEAMKVAHVNGASAFGKLTAKQQAAAKQQATNNLIMKQSKDSMGAFGRETNTFAHQTQVLSAQWENFKATLGTYLLPVLTKTVAFISSNAPAALAFLQEKLGPVITSVRGFFNGISTGGGQAGAILTQFRATASEALTNVQSIFTSTVSIVTSLWARFGGDLTTFAQSSLQNLLTVVRGAFTVLGGIFKTVAALLKGDWRGVWNGIKQIMRGALTVLKGLASQGAATIRAAFSIGLKALSSIVRGAFGGLKSAAAWGANALVTYVKGIPAKVKSGLSGAKTMLYAIGGQIIDGLANGIKAAAHKAVDAVKDVGGKVKSGFKKVMEVFSPSRYTRRIGRFVSEGLGLGIRLGTPGVLKAVRRQGVDTKKEYAKQTRDITRGMLSASRARVKALVAQRADYARAVADSARQFGALGTLQLGENETLTASKIKQHFTDRLAAIRNFNTKLAQLRKKGVSNDVYNQVVQMGVEQGTAYADALAASSPAAIKEINSLNSQISTASNSLGKNTSNALYKSGVDAARGFHNGLVSYLKKIDRAGVKMSKALVKSLKRELGIRSASRVLRWLGIQSVDGLDDGLDTRRIQAKGKALAKSLTKGYANPVLDAQFKAGFQASDAKAGQQVTGDTYITIQLQVDLHSTPEEWALAMHKATESAKTLGLIRTP